VGAAGSTPAGELTYLYVPIAGGAAPTLRWVFVRRRWSWSRPLGWVEELADGEAGLRVRSRSNQTHASQARRELLKAALFCFAIAAVVSGVAYIAVQLLGLPSWCWWAAAATVIVLGLVQVGPALVSAWRHPARWTERFTLRSWMSASDLTPRHEHPECAVAAARIRHLRVCRGSARSCLDGWRLVRS